MRLAGSPCALGLSLWLGLSLCALPQAVAITLPECPPVCRSGQTTFAEVTFFGASSHDIFQLTPPFVLDQSLQDSQGSGRGVVDLTTGVLRAGATAAADGLQFTVIATGGDEFTLAGLPPGTRVPVTAELLAQGFGLIPTEGQSVLSMVQIQNPTVGLATDFMTRSFQAFANPTGPNQVPPDERFPIALEATISFDAFIGTPFPLTYFLRLDTHQGTTLDFLSSAHLSFDVSPEVTITSVGEFTQATPVPEPASAVLFSTTMLLLVLVGARRIGGRATRRSWPGSSCR